MAFIQKAHRDLAKRVGITLFVLLFICSDGAFAKRETLFSIRKGKKIKTKEETKKPADVIPSSLATINALILPEAFGTIRELYQGKKKKTIIHIQDSHAHFEAQTNISNIIEFLNNHYLGEQLQVVGIEGAKGTVDLSLMKSVKDIPLRKQAADFFMEQGYLTGPEYFALGEDVRTEVFGVEEGPLYFENLNYFQQAIQISKETLPALEKLEFSLNQLKEKMYPPKLKKFNQLVSSYNKDEIGLSEYAQSLGRSAKEQKISLKRFKDVGTLLQSVEIENQIDKTRYEKEMTHLMKAMQKKLVKEEIEELVSLSLSYRIGRLSAPNYFKKLVEFSKQAKIPLTKKYPNFYLYSQLVQTQSQVNVQNLINQIVQLEEAVKERLYTSKKQKKLDKTSKRVALITRLAKLHLSRQDLKEYKEHKRDYDLQRMIPWVRQQLVKYQIDAPLDENYSRINQDFTFAERFYEAALRRDDVIVENILAKMQEGKIETAVLVSGGFHTGGITRRLKAKDISYAVVMPRMTEIFSDELYLKLMMGEPDSFLQAFQGVALAPEVRQINIAILEGISPAQRRRLEELWGLTNTAWISTLVGLLLQKHPAALSQLKAKGRIRDFGLREIREAIESFRGGFEEGEQVRVNYRGIQSIGPNRYQIPVIVEGNEVILTFDLSGAGVAVTAKAAKRPAIQAATLRELIDRYRSANVPITEQTSVGGIGRVEKPSDVDNQAHERFKSAFSGNAVKTNTELQREYLDLNGEVKTGIPQGARVTPVLQIVDTDDVRFSTSDGSVAYVFTDFKQTGENEYQALIYVPRGFYRAAGPNGMLNALAEEYFEIYEGWTHSEASSKGQLSYSTSQARLEGVSNLRQFEIDQALEQNDYDYVLSLFDYHAQDADNALRLYAARALTRSSAFRGSYPSLHQQFFKKLRNLEIDTRGETTDAAIEVSNRRFIFEALWLAGQYAPLADKVREEQRARGELVAFLDINSPAILEKILQNLRGFNQYPTVEEVATQYDISPTSAANLLNHLKGRDDFQEIVRQKISQIMQRVQETGSTQESPFLTRLLEENLLSDKEIVKLASILNYPRGTAEQRLAFETLDKRLYFRSREILRRHIEQNPLQNQKSLFDSFITPEEQQKRYQNRFLKLVKDSVPVRLSDQRALLESAIARAKNSAEIAEIILNFQNLYSTPSQLNLIDLRSFLLKRAPPSEVIWYSEEAAPDYSTSDLARRVIVNLRIAYEESKAQGVENKALKSVLQGLFNSYFELILSGAVERGEVETINLEFLFGTDFKTEFANELIDKEIEKIKANQTEIAGGNFSSLNGLSRILRDPYTFIGTWNGRGIKFYTALLPVISTLRDSNQNPVDFKLLETVIFNELFQLFRAAGNVPVDQPAALKETFEQAGFQGEILQFLLKDKLIRPKDIDSFLRFYLSPYSSQLAEVESERDRINVHLEIAEKLYQLRQLGRIRVSELSDQVIPSLLVARQVNPNNTLGEWATNTLGGLYQFRLEQLVAGEDLNLIELFGTEYMASINQDRLLNKETYYADMLALVDPENADYDLAIPAQLERADAIALRLLTTSGLRFSDNKIIDLYNAYVGRKGAAKKLPQSFAYLSGLPVVVAQREAAEQAAAVKAATEKAAAEAKALAEVQTRESRYQQAFDALLTGKAADAATLEEVGFKDYLNSFITPILNPAPQVRVHPLTEINNVDALYKLYQAGLLSEDQKETINQFYVERQAGSGIQTPTYLQSKEPESLRYLFASLQGEYAFREIAFALFNHVANGRELDPLLLESANLTRERLLQQEGDHFAEQFLNVLLETLTRGEHTESQLVNYRKGFDYLQQFGLFERETKEAILTRLSERIEAYQELAKKDRTTQADPIFQLVKDLYAQLGGEAALTALEAEPDHPFDSVAAAEATTPVVEEAREILDAQEAPAAEELERAVAVAEGEALTFEAVSQKETLELEDLEFLLSLLEEGTITNNQLSSLKQGNLLRVKIETQAISDFLNFDFAIKAGTLYDAVDDFEVTQKAAGSVDLTWQELYRLINLREWEESELDQAGLNELLARGNLPDKLPAKYSKYQAAYDEANEALQGKSVEVTNHKVARKLIRNFKLPFDQPVKARVVVRVADIPETGFKRERSSERPIGLYTTFEVVDGEILAIVHVPRGRLERAPANVLAIGLAHEALEIFGGLEHGVVASELELALSQETTRNTWGISDRHLYDLEEAVREKRDRFGGEDWAANYLADLTSNYHVRDADNQFRLAAALNYLQRTSARELNKLLDEIERYGPDVNRLESAEKFAQFIATARAAAAKVEQTQKELEQLIEQASAKSDAEFLMFDFAALSEISTVGPNGNLLSTFKAPSLVDLLRRVRINGKPLFIVFSEAIEDKKYINRYSLLNLVNQVVAQAVLQGALEGEKIIEVNDLRLRKSTVVHSTDSEERIVFTSPGAEELEREDAYEVLSLAQKVKAQAEQEEKKQYVIRLDPTEFEGDEAGLDKLAQQLRQLDRQTYQIELYSYSASPEKVREFKQKLAQKGVTGLQVEGDLAWEQTKQDQNIKRPLTLVRQKDRSKIAAPGRQEDYYHLPIQSLKDPNLEEILILATGLVVNLDKPKPVFSPEMIRIMRLFLGDIGSDLTPQQAQRFLENPLAAEFTELVFIPVVETLPDIDAIDRARRAIEIAA